MKCIKKLALLEPLVDCVEPDQVVSQHQCVKSVDLASCTKADLTFAAPFRLPAVRNDFVHALVAYFDVTFSSCHKPVVLPTGPQHKPTHWKQTVFYLEDDLTVCSGEAITGTLHVAPNAKNPRDLDISIDYAFEGARSAARRLQHYRMR